MGFAFALLGGGVGEGGDVPVDAHLFEYGVVADFAEPVAGVELVGFGAVEDGVPVAASGGVKVLRYAMGLGPEAAAEPEAGEDGRRQLGSSQQRFGVGARGEDGGDFGVGRHRFYCDIGRRMGAGTRGCAERGGVQAVSAHGAGDGGASAQCAESAVGDIGRRMEGW